MSDFILAITRPLLRTSIRWPDLVFGLFLQRIISTRSVILILTNRCLLTEDSAPLIILAEDCGNGHPGSLPPPPRANFVTGPDKSDVWMMRVRVIAASHYLVGFLDSPQFLKTIYEALIKTCWGGRQYMTLWHTMTLYDTLGHYDTIWYNILVRTMTHKIIQ